MCSGLGHLRPAHLSLIHLSSLAQDAWSISMKLRVQASRNSSFINDGDVNLTTTSTRSLRCRNVVVGIRRRVDVEALVWRVAASGPDDSVVTMEEMRRGRSHVPSSKG
jgi:hypothetical protein